MTTNNQPWTPYDETVATLGENPATGEGYRTATAQQEAYLRAIRDFGAQGVKPKTTDASVKALIEAAGALCREPNPTPLRHHELMSDLADAVERFDFITT